MSAENKMDQLCGLEKDISVSKKRAAHRPAARLRAQVRSCRSKNSRNLIEPRVPHIEEADCFMSFFSTFRFSAPQ